MTLMSSDLEANKYLETEEPRLPRVPMIQYDMEPRLLRYFNEEFLFIFCMLK